MNPLLSGNKENLNAKSNKKSNLRSQTKEIDVFTLMWTLPSFLKKTGVSSPF